MWQHFNVLRGLKPPLDLSTKIFGQSVRLPFFPSPTAGQRMWHPSGEACVAKVAMEKGMAYGLSSLATTSISEAAQACPRGPKVFQLYVWKDRGLLRQVISQVGLHECTSRGSEVRTCTSIHRDRCTYTSVRVHIHAHTQSRIQSARRTPQCQHAPAAHDPAPRGGSGSDARGTTKRQHTAAPKPVRSGLLRFTLYAHTQRARRRGRPDSTRWRSLSTSPGAFHPRLACRSARSATLPNIRYTRARTRRHGNSIPRGWVWES